MGGSRARAAIFWASAAAISIGVILHLPMLAEAHRMGNHLAGMKADPAMLVGMALIFLGVPAAIYGALPPRRAPHDSYARTRFEAPDSTPLTFWHAAVLAALAIGLVIDVMKPATLGFVIPGMASEYGLPISRVALLPFIALTGTALGSLLWGWIADAYGRRVSILLSTVLFVSTSICGAMPAFELNLLMCFLMGCSAGGMLPVVYTLLAEIMPPRHRSWVLVLIGGTGLIGGYLAASASAHTFEPEFGWRFLWLQGFPTGLLLLALARVIPESPRFLAEQGRTKDLALLEKRFGIVAQSADPRRHPVESPLFHNAKLTSALVAAALAWSFVNFGLLLWLPTELSRRGYSAALASGILASSALVALPTVIVAAILYSRWSSKWTLVATIAITLTGLVGALIPVPLLGSRAALVTVIALLIVGANGIIAVLLPYTAENYPLGSRGRVTGIVAGASKVGGVAVQGFALLGILPGFGTVALLLAAPMMASGALIAWTGPETRGRSLGELEREAAA